MIIMTHTHWDREWYESFESFRYKLRHGMDGVARKIQNGELAYFFLDGQTVVLEDYREIANEEDYQRLVQLIQNKKIEVGPWYLLADEFLVSGESLIKNLEFGTDTAKQLGSAHNIGYLPDTFGHVSQMPQILAGFEIEHALIWRGCDAEAYENNWQSPDGSAVKTIVLPLFEGYYQTYLNADNFAEQVTTFIEKHRERVKNGTLLLMNGADHSIIIDQMAAKIKTIQADHPELTIIEGNMSTFVDEISQAPFADTIYGERRENEKIFLLPNVLSTRLYLKEQNQRCEDWAIHYLDTFSLFARDTALNEQFRRYIWKTLLKNQPHDSICGCSIDEVHNEMEGRSVKVLSAIDQYLKSTLQQQFPYKYGATLAANPFLYLTHVLPFATSVLTEIEVIVPVQDDTGNILLTDAKGQSALYDVLERKEEERLFRNVYNEPQYHQVVAYRVALLAFSEGIETKRYQYQQSDKPLALFAATDKKNSIENDYLKITADLDGIVVLDKESNQIYRNINEFRASLDVGDSYNYSPPLEDVISDAKISKVSCQFVGDTHQELVVHYELNTPKELNKERTTGSTEKAVTEIRSSIRLVKGSRRIQFKTTVTNRAKDQKIVLRFGVGQADDSLADTAFDIIKRKTDSQAQYDADKNKEVRVQQHPTQSTIWVNGFQFTHRGLQEYQIAREEQDYLQVTFLRSVGWLSRRDLRTRGNGAGPGFEAPGAQCLGTYTFEYSLQLGMPEIDLNESKKWRVQPVFQQADVSRDETKIYAQLTQNTVFSSAKMVDENVMELRYFNPQNKHVKESFQFKWPVKQATVVNLNKKIIENVEGAQELSFSFAPFCIKTIHIYFEKEQKEELECPKY
ncbi:glycoside hydrolase family 38 C-terminal domain-containing protein [Listeria costaricensis]|uniref:glycoside hydrolase family 38 N-terminal domain-containing protein n=1 Tax=Listeria costaricensis TaxID=2026604 RepID=UPI001F08CF91|nr:glycoside hydrolase family 38 C-terminal domain-containing protein [Listeria costaricensis]